MAIGKRFTHLNNSGSNHKILDAESAYVTGTLQVGPSIPVLGSDVNFFVSGNIGGTGSLTPGVGVFGGDLVVSGNLIVEGTYPSGGGGENYFWSPANAEIEASGSLHISQSFRALSLSASNGAEVSGSAIFAGAGGVTVGSDTVFFVSGAIDGVSAGNGVAAFGGDLFVSGNMYVSGTTELWNNTEIGISGEGASLEIRTDDANTNINLNVANDKTISIINNDFSTISDKVEITSGSIKLLQNFQNYGGGESPDLIVEANRIAYTATNPDALRITSDGALSLSASNGLKVTGSAVFTGGITGSLNWIDEAGTVPFLVAGPNTTVNFNNGQWEITGSDEAQPEWYYTANVDEIGTSGSVAIDANLTVTGSAIITGSLTVAPAGTGRGLLKFGGLDIGPITGSASTSTDAILNGNILSASAGVWNGTNPAVLRHEFHILGIGVDNGSGVQTFAATYLVMSAVDTGGVQTALSVTEVSRETSGSFAAAWDVNVANNCAVEVTSSIDAGSVEWYAQRVKEMSVNSVGSRT